MGYKGNNNYKKSSNFIINKAAPREMSKNIIETAFRNIFES